MIERGISKRQVEDCIRNPANIAHDKYCNKVFQKLINGKLLRVVITYENNDIKVITAYTTSKTQKYYMIRHLSSPTGHTSHHA